VGLGGVARHVEADPASPTVVLAGTDAVLMPVLGRAKQRVGSGLRSHATTSEGRQNFLCAYRSLAVLRGLAPNVQFGWWWADPMVALVVAVIVIQAGARIWRGQACDKVGC
jgi:divalent metal cation (Fe/Co/Zn/Cd) transporter